MRALLFIASLMLATPALAQTKVVLADCKPGGCRCSLSNATGEEAAIATGIDLPDGWQDMTLVGDDGAYYWSQKSREDIDVTFGGDGQCDLELFAAVIPEDGTWLGTVGTAAVGQCPAGIAATLQPELDAMAFPRQMAWGGRFDPDALRIGKADRAIRWTEVRPDYFTGASVINGAAGASDVVEITVDYTATLVSPTQMDGTVALRIRAKGDNAAILAQLGMANCKVDVPLAFNRTGP